MGADERFFDTRLVLYLLSADTAKADRAETLLAGGGVIGVQVLNEAASAASRKLAMSWQEIREVLTTVRAVCRVAPLTVATHDTALAVAERWRLSFYDSLICAAALQAGCSTLYSEDMQDGETIDGLTIRDPLRS